MKIEQVSLSPAQAAKLLEKNTVNRKRSRARVAALAACIQRGEWMLDGNPIKLAEDDTVLDGQHRLAAIAEAGVEVPVIIISGLPAESRLVVDSGKARSFDDFLHMQGVLDSRKKAAAVRSFWYYQGGLHDWHEDWFTRPIPSYAQLWELFLKRRQDFEEAVSRSQAVTRAVRVAGAPVAAGWLIFGDVECDECGPGQDSLEEFYDELAMRLVTQNDNVTMFIKLMNRKERTDAAVGRSAYSQTVQLALLIKTWNAFREGRPITALRWRRGGKSPEGFPVPH